MAQVQDVDMTFERSGSNVDITVKGSLKFATGEVGTKFRLGIDIYGVELPGEGYVPINQPPLYTFRFGPLWSRREYVTITANGSPQPFAFSRTVPRSVLDEDPGYQVVWGGLLLPYPDEIRATVTLSQVESAVSPVVTIAT